MVVDLGHGKGQGMEESDSGVGFWDCLEVLFVLARLSVI